MNRGQRRQPPRPPARGAERAPAASRRRQGTSLQANTKETQMQQFRDAVESRDLDALLALFTDDIVFRSPAVHAPYQGRAQVEALLRAVGELLEDFGYT